MSIEMQSRRHPSHDDTRSNAASPLHRSSPAHVHKPYHEIMKRGCKRTKTDPIDDEVEVIAVFDPNRRRTKKDSRREEALMHKASEKIENLTAMNAQLQLRLEQALIENAKLRLALDKECQLSYERDASNQALRLLLLEERTKSKLSVSSIYPYQAIETIHPRLPSPPVLPSPKSEPPRFLPSEIALEMERIQRGGITSADLSETVKEQYYSQLTATRLREELASIIGRSRGS